ncbi:MAG TPA: DNA primase [Terriglobales bacterium]
MPDFAQELKQQADIVRVIGDYIKLKKTGAQNFSGLCPFHNEKTPSFSVHATRQFFHCFGCGESGDVFKFVQKIESITFPEAIRSVAQRLGIPMPKQGFSSPLEAREAKERTALIEIHEHACNFFQEQLRRPEGARAREYLKGRELTDEAARQFRIGFAPDSGFVLRDALRGKFSDDLLKISGLFSWKDAPSGKEGDAQSRQAVYSKFRNRIIFPIANEQGKIIAFTARSIEAGDKAGPKYLNSPETPIYSKGRVLFNLDKAREAIRKLDYAILVEGNVDCISVFMAGFQNVLATSGTAFTEAQVRLLARFTKNVVVNFDPDTAGAAATERSLAMLVQEDFQVKVVTLETGFDPDLFIRKQGRKAYGDALMRSPRYFDYLIERTRSKFPVKTADGKAKAIAYLLPYIKQAPNAIVRDELAREVAQKLGVDSALLANELRTAARSRGAVFRAPREPQITEAEKVLLRVLAPGAQGADPELRMRAAEVLGSEQLHQGLASEGLLDALLAEDDPGAESSRLLASVLMQESEEMTHQALESTFEALRRGQIERKQRALKARIAEAERKNDSASLAALLQEKLKIDQALTKAQ